MSRVLRCGSFEDIFRIAMPVRFTPEEEAAMRGEGMYPVTDPEMVETNVMPGVGNRKKDIKGLVGQLSLPRIAFPTAKNLVEIDGRQYYLVDVVPPKPKANPEGSLYLLDIESGAPVKLPLMPYRQRMEQIKADQIRTSVEEVNAKIRKWNDIVSRVGSVANPSTWPLQLRWAEDVIGGRLADLRSMISSIRRQTEFMPERSPAYDASIERMKQDVAAGRITDEADLIDTIMFVATQDRAFAENVVGSAAIPMPDHVRDKARQLLDMHAQGVEDKKRKDMESEEARRQRMTEPDVDYGTPTLSPMEEEAPGDRGKYPSADLYFERGSKYRQNIAKVIGMERDMGELAEVQGALTGLRQYIGALATGMRSEEFLASESGQEVHGNIARFVEVAKKFLKRYASEVFVPTDSGSYAINPKLFGRSGSGNSQVAVAVNQVLGVISNSQRQHQDAAIADMAGVDLQSYTYDPNDVQ